MIGSGHLVYCIRSEPHILLVRLLMKREQVPIGIRSGCVNFHQLHTSLAYSNRSVSVLSMTQIIPSPSDVISHQLNNQNLTLSILVVVPPQRPDLISGVVNIENQWYGVVPATNIPYCKIDILVL